MTKKISLKKNQVYILANIWGGMKAQDHVELIGQKELFESLKHYSA